MMPNAGLLPRAPWGRTHRAVSPSISPGASARAAHALSGRLVEQQRDEIFGILRRDHPIGGATMTASADVSAVDFVNPYLSARRQWVCTQLATVLPNTMIKLKSNDPATRAKFEEWTGQSQSSLESAWAGQGFRRSKTP